MRKHVKFAGLVVVCAVVLGAGYWIGAARAAGIPATETLAYSGELTDGGTVATGSYMIGVSLWSDGSSATGTFRECDTPAASTTVSSGHFRVPLDPTCVQAVRDNPELWAQVTVSGTALVPRTHISAVPYAIEAAHLSVTGPSWLGVTTMVTSGDIVRGGLRGYAAAAAICAGEFAGHPNAHMCTASEVTTSAAFPPVFTVAARYAWYASGVANVTSTDCSGYEDARATSAGSEWVFPDQAPTTDACSLTRPILCCD